MSIFKRPQFIEMNERLVAKEANTIIIEHPNVLGRNPIGRLFVEVPLMLKGNRIYIAGPSRRSMNCSEPC